MKLNIPFNTFKEEVMNIASEGQKILEQKIITEEDLKAFTAEKNRWLKEAGNYLKSSFSGNGKDSFGEGFLFANNFNLGFSLPIAQRAKNAKDTMLEKVDLLPYYVELLAVSDAFIDPEIVNREDRKNWSINKKKILILKKLKHLNNGKLHDLAFILLGNGINSNNPDEARQLAKSLEESDYIRPQYHKGGASVRITLEGLEYLESLDEQKTEQSTNATKTDIEDINEKLDQVLELLKRNEMGNEIIFNEIDELREAGNTLNLKNWKQLVAGKILDMGASAAVGLGRDTLVEMFKTLTGQDPTKLL